MGVADARGNYRGTPNNNKNKIRFRPVLMHKMHGRYSHYGYLEAELGAAPVTPLHVVAVDRTDRQQATEAWNRGMEETR